MPTPGKLWQQLRAGAISAVDALSVCAGRLRRHAPLNAFITETLELAQRLAKDSDDRRAAGRTLGPLDGLPVAVKDNFNTKGVLTTCASRMLANYVPPYDATVVEKLYREGMVLLGKTNMDEFAMGSGSVDSIFGPTRNPWPASSRSKQSNAFDEEAKTVRTNPEEGSDFFIAGGSSGGSAVAVACGVVYAALGSDTGGSVRTPASHCGVVGLKPTYGLLSRHGLIPLVNSMDVPAILAADVHSCVEVLNALAGRDQKDPTSTGELFSRVQLLQEPDLKAVRIGIPQEYHAFGLAPEVLGAWRRVSDALEGASASVVPVSLPHTRYANSCYSVLNAAEVASNMARYDGIEYGHRAAAESSTEALYAATRHEGFNDVVRGRIFAGNYFLLRSNYDKYYVQAQRVRRLIADDFAAVFGRGGGRSSSRRKQEEAEVDILLTPVSPDTAPLHSAFTSLDNRSQCVVQDVYTQPCSLAGLPAVVVPVCLSSSGMPIGLQLIAPHFHEQLLLTVAKWIEQHVQYSGWPIEEQ